MKFVAAISDVVRPFAVGVPQGLEFFMPFETMVELSVDKDKTVTPLLPPSTRIIAIVSFSEASQPLSRFVELPPKSPSGVTYSRFEQLETTSSSFSYLAHMLPEHFCNSPVDDEFVFSATVSLGLDFSTISDIITLGFGYISEIGNPLPCRTTYQKLAASCSEARPKYLSIYTGNERAILLFLLFESAVLVLLAGLVRFCCIFWRKKKLQGQDLGKFLEKAVKLLNAMDMLLTFFTLQHSLRLQKKEFDRTITELEKKAAEEASTSAVLEKLGDLSRRGKAYRGSSQQRAKKESVTIFHTVSDASSGESYSDREISWHSFEDKESAAKAKAKAKAKAPIADGSSSDDRICKEDYLGSSSEPASSSTSSMSPLFMEKPFEELREVKPA
ncbi:Protein gamete expressed 3 [Vitis vinifera]|uniref:Protein gamete expressed 3 n=1 Tax=Vitis vinifera TaxID=29760 RepID=A0A438JC57_VITVI|nr:Protein gamete expressed 3 [Vitis vinifera]